MAILRPGEDFIWSNKASDDSVTPARRCGCAVGFERQSMERLRQQRPAQLGIEPAAPAVGTRRLDIGAEVLKDQGE
jgi:hypothetical protein